MISDMYSGSGMLMVDYCFFSQIIGAAAGDNLGRSVSNAGDVNGDGIDDIIIGAPGVDANRRTNAGAVYVIFGRSRNRLFLDIDLASSSFAASGTGFKVFPMILVLYF